jgi:hypothetical protein
MTGYPRFVFETSPGFTDVRDFTGRCQELVRYGV